LQGRSATSCEGRDAYGRISNTVFDDRIRDTYGVDNVPQTEIDRPCYGKRSIPTP